ANDRAPAPGRAWGFILRRRQAMLIVAPAGFAGAARRAAVQAEAAIATPGSGDADDALMARVAAGDAAAFARLMERHVDGAFRVAQRILGSSAEAEEAVQEAFLRL